MSSALADGTLLAQQACFLPTSPDDLPVLGKIPGIEGAYIASGACTQLLKPRCEGYWFGRSCWNMLCIFPRYKFCL